MKNLYVCEKCGKIFDDWDDAYACERSHIDIDMLYSFQIAPMNDNEFAQLQFFSKGKVFPTKIVMQAYTYDDDGRIIYQTMPDGTKAPVMQALFYDLSKDGTAPNGLTLADYDKLIAMKQTLDHQPKNEEEDN